MKVIFCSDPLDSRKPDMMYEKEASAVDQLGLKYSLIGYEALVNESNPEKAVQRVEQLPDPEPGIYRGWMLKPHQYQQLYDALTHQGIRLINDPTAYKHCHYLPESYSIIEGYTPKSVWMRVTIDVSMDEIIELLRHFNSKPVIVKDFVKSQKHYWNES
jgi:hypothetical protein